MVLAGRRTVELVPAGSAAPVVEDVVVLEPREPVAVGLLEAGHAERP